MEENITNYHFFPASLRYYSNYSFKELLEEYNKYDKYIFWPISGKDGSRLHEVKENHICYIYYSCLPDESSRILFVGQVVESDYDKTDRTVSICEDAVDGRLYAKLKIYSVNLEDEYKEEFSLKRLRTVYKLINQNGQIGYCKVNKNDADHKKLINDIEKAIKEHGKHELKYVNDYFNDNFCLCEFKGEDEKRKNHDTFIEENGFYYIEKHHLVEKNLITKYKDIINDIDKIINQEENLFNLCPNCHMEMHHGQKARRREKIKFLYEKNDVRKAFFDNNFNELKNGKNTLEWLYEIYKCEE